MVDEGQPGADPPRPASPTREMADREAQQSSTETSDDPSRDPADFDDLEGADTLVDNSSVGDSAVDLPDDVSRPLVPTRKWNAKSALSTGLEIFGPWKRQLRVSQTSPNQLGFHPPPSRDTYSRRLRPIL